MCIYVVICQIDHCMHIHWCIVMGLGHNDPWVESHMWPQQTWGQRSCRGQWPSVQVFGKKDQCIHILWCIFKSNITMIAKVCARESRRDSWFENRLVLESWYMYGSCFKFPAACPYQNQTWVTSPQMMAALLSVVIGMRCQISQDPTSVQNVVSPKCRFPTSGGLLIWKIKRYIKESTLSVQIWKTCCHG